jgi:phospholipase C
MKTPQTMRRLALRLLPLAAAGAAVGVAFAGPTTAVEKPGRPQPAAVAPAASPIDNVVVIYLENHSFDNVLGKFCVNNPARGCSGATTGKMPDGSVRALTDQPDLIPEVGHQGHEQIAAINGGKMDGWPSIRGCGPTPEPNSNNSMAYGCYTQVTRPVHQIPSLLSLIRKFALSDRTFQMDNIPSWHAHMELATGTLDGYVEDPGINPMPSRFTTQTGPGWGCDSFRDAWWSNGGPKQLVPACIPDKLGKGPYRSSPVKYVPTIMTRLQNNGLSWRIYDGTLDTGGHWGICPTFYECIGSSQKANRVRLPDFVTDAKSGKLPKFSIVIPRGDLSQHNGGSMLKGDNWLASQVSAVMNGPNWKSSAIFITYDDCGCFYDHVPPPPGLGLRVPMVIVSPYAKSGYTDHKTASIASILAFTEHNFGLAPLTQADASAYDYRDSFNYAQVPLGGVQMTSTPLPAWEEQWLKAHPFDPTDPENAT